MVFKGNSLIPFSSSVHLYFLAIDDSQFRILRIIHPTHSELVTSSKCKQYTSIRNVLNKYCPSKKS